MARPRKTPVSVARTAPARSFEAPGAEAFAGFLRDLRQELQEPPEFLPRDAHPRTRRRARGGRDRRRRGRPLRHNPAGRQRRRSAACRGASDGAAR